METTAGLGGGRRGLEGSDGLLVSSTISISIFSVPTLSGSLAFGRGGAFFGGCRLLTFFTSLFLSSPTGAHSSPLIAA